MSNTWPLVFGHSPPRQAWIKNILGLFWRFGQFALSKRRKASCNWEKTVNNLHCSLLWATPSLTLLPFILAITSLILVLSPLSSNSLCDKHIPFPPSPLAPISQSSSTLPHTCTGKRELNSFPHLPYFYVILYLTDLSWTASCPFLPTSPYFCHLKKCASSVSHHFIFFKKNFSSPLSIVTFQEKTHNTWGQSNIPVVVCHHCHKPHLLHRGKVELQYMNPHPDDLAV